MNKILNCRTILSVMIILFILNSTLGDNTDKFVKFLDSPYIKIAFLITITYIASFDSVTAIILALLYLVAIQQTCQEDFTPHMPYNSYKYLGDDELLSDSDDEMLDNMVLPVIEEEKSNSINYKNKIKSEIMKLRSIIKSEKFNVLAKRTSGSEMQNLKHKAEVENIKIKTLDKMQKSSIASEEAKLKGNTDESNIHKQSADNMRIKMNAINRLSKVINKIKDKGALNDYFKEKVKIELVDNIEDNKMNAQKLYNNGEFKEAKNKLDKVNEDTSKLNSILISEKVDKEIEMNVKNNKPIDEVKLKKDGYTHKIVTESLVNMEKNMFLAERTQDESDKISHLNQVNAYNDIIDAYVKADLYNNASQEAKEIGAIEESKKLNNRSIENQFKAEVLLKMKDLDQAIINAKENNNHFKTKKLEEEQNKTRIKLVSLLQKQEHDDIVEETNDIEIKKDNKLKSDLQVLKLKLLSDSDKNKIDNIYKTKYQDEVVNLLINSETLKNKAESEMKNGNMTNMKKLFDEAVNMEKKATKVLEEAVNNKK